MKKICLLIFIFGAASLFADASDIVIKAEAQPRILKSGDKLHVKVDYSFPEDRHLSGYLLAAYLPFVPKAFPEATGLPVGKNPDPRWRGIHISGWHWFKSMKRQPGEVTLEFDTVSWPAGDYKLELRGLFREQKPSVKTDLYRSAYFYLTIVAP